MSSMVGALAEGDEGPTLSEALEAGGGGALESLNSEESKEEDEEAGDGGGGLLSTLRLRDAKLL